MANGNGDKSRLRLTLLLIAVAFVEALVRAVWPSFPITELYSIQSIAFGGYMTVRTISNIDEAKYANGTKC
jgi:hypothetical protein